jgi:hypothetical protein
MSCTGSGVGVYYDIRFRTDGTFYAESTTGLEALTDGTSNVIVFSESIIGDGYMPGYGGPMGGGLFAGEAPDPMQPHTRSAVGPLFDDVEANWRTQQGSEEIAGLDVATLAFTSETWVGWRGYLWISGRMNATTFSTFSTPNPPYPDWGSYPTMGFHAARSFHRGGVNALRGDGSVIFVSDLVSLEIWRAMGRVASGQPKRAL